jgi:hypothetical protein
MGGMNRLFTIAVGCAVTGPLVGCRAPSDGATDKSLLEDAQAAWIQVDLWMCECEGMSSDVCAEEFVWQDGGDSAEARCGRDAVEQVPEFAAYLRCETQATHRYANCLRGSSCDDYGNQTICGQEFESAMSRCPEPSWEAEIALEEAFERCFQSDVLGPLSGCPDSTTTSTDLGEAVFEGNTIGAGDDLNSASCGGDGGAPDRALLWTAPASGNFQIDTYGSSFDTVLYVLPSCDAPPIVCNDDGPSGLLQSEVSLFVELNQQVIIVVDGFDSYSAGDFVVNISQQASLP